MLQGRLDIKYLLKVAFEKTNYEPFYYKTFNPFECGDLSSCGLFAAGINVYGESKNKGFKNHLEFQFYHSISILLNLQ